LGKAFAEKVSDVIQPVSAAVDSACILITRNVGRGKIPSTTKKFLKRYGQHVIGVVVNGDRRFGKYYCAAGPKIQDLYHVPIIRNIEGAGDDDDVREVAAFIQSRA
jgi:protein involved in ribonucleotide reduction